MTRKPDRRDRYGRLPNHRQCGIFYAEFGSPPALSPTMAMPWRHHEHNIDQTIL
jgi:hypothetical protein